MDDVDQEVEGFEAPFDEELERSAARLEEIHAALRALDEGSYGVCEECGAPIEAERLEAHPTARSCGQHPQLTEVAN